MNKGTHYEDAAAGFLKENGFHVRARNFSTRWGEIDIIAEKHDTVYFIEVKGRKADSWYEPEEAVRLHKQQKVYRAAQWYAQEYGLKQNLSLGAISVIERGHSQEIEFFEDIMD